MGLDAYVEVGLADPNKYVRRDEIWYGRKNWAIQHWMHERYTERTKGSDLNPDFNGPDLEITRELIEQLKTARLNQTLLGMAGEFSGIADYHLEGLNMLIKACEDHLNTSDIPIFYCASY